MGSLGRVRRAMAATACAAFAAGAAAAADTRLTSGEIDIFLQQAAAKAIKPAALSPRGTDACYWANDMECDEPDIGTGACAPNTDYSDCRFLRFGETDDCQWANDGECDEPGLGAGVCTQGTDRTDCASMAHLRFRTDSCATAFNNVCEEQGTRLRDGPGICPPRTDRADCVGRERPATINDHFQGQDDRVLLDAAVYPWSAIGRLVFDDGLECTGVLVDSDVVLTAAHCVHDEEGHIATAGEFRAGFGRAGGPLDARIAGYLVAPRFDRDVYLATSKFDGRDWAYLRLDQPLGDELGVLAIAELETVDGVVLDRAGYGWDTNGRLAGHLGCAPTRLGRDGTLEHTCDMTRGDSGSPLMIAHGGTYSVVGIISLIREKEDGSMVNIATGSRAFAPYLEDFAARRTGTDLSRPSKGKS
jgi:protease YdgD